MLTTILSEIGHAGLRIAQALGWALLVAVTCLVCARVISGFIVNRIKKSSILAKYGQDGEMIASRLVSIVAYTIAIAVYASVLGLDTGGILTLLSALTVAFGLAMQDIMRNFMSGIFMLIERPFSVGDHVKIRSNQGTIQGIDIRTTMLRTDEGSLLMVPNSIMFTEILQNDNRYNIRHLKLQITVPKDQQIAETVQKLAVKVEGLRLPVELPYMIKRDAETATWQLGVSYDARQATREREITAFFVQALPDALIERVD